MFLLIVPNYIFIWTGKKSNHFERLAAVRIANELKNELARFNLSIVILDDDQESEQLSNDESAAFNNLLPLESKNDLIKSAEEIDWTNDEIFETNERNVVHLYQCQETDGVINIESVKDGPLTRDDLNSNVKNFTFNHIHSLFFMTA